MKKEIELDRSIDFDRDLNSGDIGDISVGAHSTLQAKMPTVIDRNRNATP